MPRKSSAALAIVPGVPATRPEPPSELSAEQAREWRLIVAEQPVDYFLAGQFPLLVAYVRAITAARTIAGLVRDCDPAKELARYDRLSRMAAQQATVISMLATKMRLTHTGRYRVDKRIPTATAVKPWDRHA